MKSQDGEETDEETYDDPIRLFDNDENTTYFGSKPHGHHGTKNIDLQFQIPDELRQPKENSTLESCSDDLTQKSQGSSISESDFLELSADFLELSVKLVDCGKYPWYFRKYTQQILLKTNLNVEGHGDQEIDVVGIEDSQMGDCFIIEDLKNISNETKNHLVEKANVLLTRPQINKIVVEERRMKLKDIEIQKALSQKNLAKVDIKRNQGLVGLKITQKKASNVALDVTRNRSTDVIEVAKTIVKGLITDNWYVSAADKTLSHVGTELIPISSQVDNNIFTQITKNTEADKCNMVTQKPKKVKPKNIENVPVHYSWDKTCQKFMNNTNLQETNDCSSTAKFKLEMSNGVFVYPEYKLINSNEEELKSKQDTAVKQPYISGISSHVKDFKKTNKYKNSLIKNDIGNNDKTHLGLLTSEPRKIEIKELTYTKKQKPKTLTEVTGGKQSHVVEVGKISHKNVENVHTNEPSSPILQCSTVPKKRKLKDDTIHKFNELDANLNLSKGMKYLDERINELETLNLRNAQNSSESIISNSFTCKSSDVHINPVLQKKTSSLRDTVIREVNDVRAPPLKAKQVKNCNDVNETNIKSKTCTKTSQSTSSYHAKKKQVAFNLASDARKHNDKKDTGSANLSYKQKYSNGKFPTAIVIPSGESNAAMISNHYASFPNSSSVQNIAPGNIVRDRDNYHYNNFNNSVQNGYASSIIFKPNQQMNFQAGNNQPKHPVTTTGPQIPANTPIQTQPRYQNGNVSLPVTTTGHQIPANIPVHTQPRYQNSKFHPENHPSTGVYRSYFLSSSVNNCFSNQFVPPTENMYHESFNSTKAVYQGRLPQNLTQPSPYPFFQPSSSHKAPRPADPHFPPPPSYNPPRSTYDINQTTHYHPSVSQQQYCTSTQNYANTPQINDSSIIGKNNDGLVKKINIVVPTSKNVESVVRSVEVNDPQIVVPRGKAEVVVTKADMLEELDKLSFADKDMKNLINVQHDGTNIEKKNASLVEILKKKVHSFESSKIKVDQKSCNTSIEQATGYSPPILPIPPVYEKVVDQAVLGTQTQSKTIKNNSDQETKINFKYEKNASLVEILKKKVHSFESSKIKVDQKSCNTSIEQATGYSPPILPIPPVYEKVVDQAVLGSPTQNKIIKNNADQETKINFKYEIKPNRGYDKLKKRLNPAFSKPKERGKKDLKKISLEEYKKRSKVINKSEQSYIKANKEKYNGSGKRPKIIDYKYRKSVDYSTETDLGYDSDSTVVL